ncbi:Nitrate/nitrite transporter NarK [Halomonadaceae bacterium LMG 33818]|uniref:MFS transporter n=1 Tax=Cernens ardua TaxID=3402176 RepID=UPI003EDBC375
MESNNTKKAVNDLSRRSSIVNDYHTPSLSGDKRWIDHFDPENKAFWQTKGRAIAKRNLWISIYTEFIGFAVWQLWAVVAPLLNKVGYSLSADQIFWLIAIPNLIGATLRFPYTFAVPRFGGRNWTIISALLLILPCSGIVYAVNHPGLPFPVLAGLAALGGFGGGNFASSMANISFFYPESEKGKALGVNAAGGNIGVAVALLIIPPLVFTGTGVHLARAGALWIPLAIIAAILAFFRMNNLKAAKADFASYKGAFYHSHTWIISIVYIATFGSFIGFSGAFPTLMTMAFPGVSLSLAFMGPLIGSLTRPLGGSLADRFGGAHVTVISLLMMIVGGFCVVHALEVKSFILFFLGFMLLFVFTGTGNGSTYRMIPAIFRAGADNQDYAAMAVIKRHAAAAIGVIAALGAYGGFFIPRCFAIAKQTSGSLIPAVYIFMLFYLLCIAIVWWCYMRSGNRFTKEGISI